MSEETARRQQEVFEEYSQCLKNESWKKDKYLYIHSNTYSLKH